MSPKKELKADFLQCTCGCFKWLIDARNEWQNGMFFKSVVIIPWNVHAHSEFTSINSMLRGKMAFKLLYFRLAFVIFIAECKKSKSLIGSHVTSIVTMKFNNSQLQSNMLFNSRHIQCMMKKLVIVRVIPFLLLFFCCMWVYYKKKHCCLIRQAPLKFLIVHIPISLISCRHLQV